MSDLDDEELKATKKIKEKSADDVFKNHNYEIEKNELSVTYTNYYKMFAPKEIVVMQNGFCKINGQLMDGEVIKAIVQKFEEKGWL